MKKSRLSRPEQVVPIATDDFFESITDLLALLDTDHIGLPLPNSTTATERSQIDQIVGLDGNSEPMLLQALNGSGLILFSSGTSGEPKAMLHRSALLDRFRNVPPRQSRTIQLLLTNHIGGIDAAMRCLISGSALIIPEHSRHHRHFLSTWAPQ